MSDESSTGNRKLTFLRAPVLSLVKPAVDGQLVLIVALLVDTRRTQPWTSLALVSTSCSLLPCTSIPSAPARALQPTLERAQVGSDLPPCTSARASTRATLAASPLSISRRLPPSSVPSPVLFPHHAVVRTARSPTRARVSPHACLLGLSMMLIGVREPEE